MGIKPTQHGIKVLFEQNHSFRVPKYQRGYAWEDPAVIDFLSDIARCLKARETGGRSSHFFGGIVAVKTDVPDSNRTQYEVIDGQQRLASFVLLAARLSQKIAQVIAGTTADDEQTDEDLLASKFLSETLKHLQRLYLSYRDNFGMSYKDVPKLILSEADGSFFQALLDGEPLDSERASHERLETAWTLMGAFIDDTIFEGGDTAGAERVRILVNEVLEFDCSVIFMAADSKREAYQIFQVLNDRGVQLTDGDLLRARTMELLDTPSLLATQDKVAKRWDEVLRFEPGDVDDYLRWYFSSNEGKRPSSSALADDYMRVRFKLQDDEALTVAQGNAILREMKGMSEAFASLETMGEGEWPMKSDPKVTQWDRDRLGMLVTHLRHTNAMPLLLALTKLTPPRFAEAVSMIERFVFRYKTIGNAHISPMTEIYHRNAKAIRDAPTTYKLKTLRDQLTELLAKNVPESLFRAKLKETQYTTRGGNSSIRYMLLALEDYRDWVDDGAAGVPKCKDKTTVIDFGNTTIEHIYPRSAKAGEKIAALEPLKDTLGNLTIFGPLENSKAGNKTFTGKLAMLKKSKIRMNRDIGDMTVWDAAAAKARTATMIDLAVKVFVP
ncbi:DUF262 domain-containing protein [Sphingomonas faeni]|uniref:DUF262 domain-containing protein n=1 Tax=Sphingomonas faeni TaxID=185950 RepID=UPI00334F64DC